MKIAWPWRKKQALTDARAAALLLRSLMRSIIVDTDDRIVDEISDRLMPSDMFRVEYMMILEAVQSLRSRKIAPSLEEIKNELFQKDPAGFAAVTLDSVVQNRREGPDDRSAVSDLVDFLITFRVNEPPN